MANQYVNKVELADGTSLIDISGDTVAADKLLSGYTAHDATGAAITGSIANGTITNNTSGGTSSGTINRGSQIKIGAGHYSADAYYTAQTNSGTLTLTTENDVRTNLSCDGYKYVTVQGINVRKPRSGYLTFTAKTPNGDGYANFVFNVDASGNVTITES